MTIVAYGLGYTPTGSTVTYDGWRIIDPLTVINVDPEMHVIRLTDEARVIKVDQPQEQTVHIDDTTVIHIPDSHTVVASDE